MYYQTHNIEKEIDKYDHIVACVFLDDESEVNLHLIEVNFVSEYYYFSKGFYGAC